MASRRPERRWHVLHHDPDYIDGVEAMVEEVVGDAVIPFLGCAPPGEGRGGCVHSHCGHASIR